MKRLCSLVSRAENSFSRLDRKYCALAVILSFAVTSLLYTHTQAMTDTESATMLHTRLDDSIPFVPAFVTAYILWYVHVPFPMLFSLFRDKRLLFRQTIELFTCILISLLFFALLPTGIDFRPTANPSNGPFEYMLSLIFENDRPLNCFPSLHCGEAVISYLTAFGKQRSRHSLPLRASGLVACILICVSTVFIKQHSILDLFGGVLLAIAIHLIYRSIFNRIDKTVPVSV